jgi:hypothetical protein
MRAPSIALLTLALAGATGCATVQTWTGIGAEDLSTMSPSSERTIYRWVDENGVAHYTTDLSRVPGNLQGIAANTGTPVRVLGARAGGPGGDDWLARDRRRDPSEWDSGTEDFAPERPRLTPEERRALDAERQAQMDDIDVRIAELAADIAADEAMMKASVMDPDSGPLSAADDPQFREIALRLPGLLDELRSLQTQREAIESAP